MISQFSQFISDSWLTVNVKCTHSVSYVLIPLGLFAGNSKKKKKNESSAIALKISNKEMESIMKIVHSLEESGLLIK